MEQDQKTQPPFPVDLPLRVDMVIGDESSLTRMAKVKHQGVEETVRVMNRVLRKMNAGVKLEFVAEKRDDAPVESIMEEPVPVFHA